MERHTQSGKGRRGYTLIECAGLDEALRWAATVPTAFNGSVEVRPVVQIPAREVPG